MHGHGLAEAPLWYSGGMYIGIGTVVLILVIIVVVLMLRRGAV
jgi:hypothetical protein